MNAQVNEIIATGVNRTGVESHKSSMQADPGR